MRKALLAGTAAVVCLSLSSQAQTITKKIQDLKGYHPSYIEFATKDAPAFVNGAVLIQNAKAKLDYERGTALLNKMADAVGFTHYRYQQTINSIPVEDAVYILHVKGGKVLSENGAWMKDIPASLSATATLKEAAALQAALKSVNAKEYRWQVENLSTPKATLVYYSDDMSVDNLRLAYKFDIYATEPLTRQFVFVDATNGKILGTKEQLHTLDGTAVTAYSGTRTIQTTKSGNNYILREATRGNGVETYNINHTVRYNSAVDFTDADNYWNSVNSNLDQYATDAHWGAEMTYDYYKTNFNRNSIDNNGFKIKSYVHYKKNYFNANWDGEEMNYGDGNKSDGFKPLTALDVCGHEISHGVTTYTAALVYKNESGALNEGFSDCMGTAIEFFARPENADWLIGKDFLTIRDMSNPNAYSQPDTYKGKYWVKPGGGILNDYGGVHTNSGVLNFWFYLLSVGGNGTNDNGTAYSVSGISIAKAQAITYRMQTTYLTANATYANARFYSIQAAADLYGASSNERTQVINAWNAVGVTTASSVAAEETSVIASSVSSLTSPVTVTKQYPNPVKNTFTLEFSAGKASSSTISVYNMSGASVYRSVVSVNAGANMVKVSLPQATPGTYIIKMDNQKISTIQVVK